MKQSYRPLRNNRQQGFTLLELLIVISVIAALMAMMLPAIGSYRERAKVRQNEALISSLAGAINAFGTDVMVDPQEGTVYRMWYLAADGFLDGDPDAADPPFSDELLKALGRNGSERTADEAMDYDGPARMLPVAIPNKHIDPETGRIMDSWGSPMRVLDPSAASGDYPYSAALEKTVVGLGLWSSGPSGDPMNTEDNIVSWSSEGSN